MRFYDIDDANTSLSLLLLESKVYFKLARLLSLKLQLLSSDVEFLKKSSIQTELERNLTNLERCLILANNNEKTLAA